MGMLLALLVTQIVDFACSILLVSCLPNAKVGTETLSNQLSWNIDSNQQKRLPFPYTGVVVFMMPSVFF